MPLGRFEWAVGLAATAVVSTIVSWYAVVWSRAGVDGSVRPSFASSEGVISPPPPPAVVPTADPAPSVPRASSRFVAVRGDSWLQVRQGSHAGRVLYEGTLAKGGTLRFRAARLWVRFGSASHVNLHLDGVLVGLPAFGTYDAFVTAGGVRVDPIVHEPAQATAAQSP